MVFQITFFGMLFAFHVYYKNCNRSQQGVNPKWGKQMMESRGIFNGTFSIIEKGLDLRSLKHKLTTSNIANADTPNYKAFDLIIGEEMKKETGESKYLELTKTNSRHFPAKNNALDNMHLTPEKSIWTQRGDGNTVDIDKSMAKLAENNLMYNALAQSISKKFTHLKEVIQGGK